MAIVLPGYILGQQIYQSPMTLVFYAVRELDNKPVVIKLLRADYPSPMSVMSFKHEYEVTKSLKNISSVIQVFEIMRYQNTYAFILEDIDAKDFNKLLTQQKKFTLIDCLDYAIKIADALGQIHAHHIIHKDINLSNVVYNLYKKQLKIIDFGLAVALSKETPVVVNPHVLAGTLSYISPEQTGRINRGIDYRTDYYSLGISLYQMLTGHLPFASQDPVELVHCHIAVMPKTPHEIDNTIPDAISSIVMKLMAKNPDERYQSSLGLIADLQNCLDQIRMTNAIQVFELGTKDVYSTFQIPEKLYGREDEIKMLLREYDEVMQAKIKLMVVEGYSGIGKSSLVNELYKPITLRNGYFISGKFEQFKHHIPYAAFIQAFQSLVSQILSENEETISSFKDKILQAVGANGQVIKDVIPSLSAIIGEQPPVPKLDVTETQNRFNYVFQNFIQAIASKEHPLVLFLDDVQWCDLSSLKLVETLITNPDCRYLFIIFSYRSNEVEPSHSLMHLFESLQKQGVSFQRIRLGPLQLNDIDQLLSDTLRQPKTTVNALSKICVEKTHGNPFFLNQFLQTLYQEQLIRFDAKRNGWVWSLDEIRDKNYAVNVVQFMIDKIDRLPIETQHVLQWAACVGNRFNVNILSKISNNTLEELLTILQGILKEGFIIALEKSYTCLLYQFSHDRIQQAAYSLVDEKQKKLIHMKLARMILNEAGETKSNEILFDIVNHFNMGSELSETDIPIHERIQIANLNLSAAKTAKLSAAFEPALRYIEHALRYTDDETWTTNYDLIFELYSQGTEIAYLNTKFDLMERYAAIAIEHARDIADECTIIQTKARAYVIQTKQQLALDTILEAYSRIGVHYPQHPNTLHILLAIMKIKFKLIGKKIPDLINLPVLTDRNVIMNVELQSIIVSASYQTRPKLFPLFLCNSTLLFLNGHAKQTAFSYTGWGMILTGPVGDIESGYQFGELGLKLLDKLNQESTKTQVVFVNYAFIKHWKDDIHSLLPKLKENFEQGLDRGEPEYACYSIFFYIFCSYLSGASLAELIPQIKEYEHRVKKMHQINTFQYISILHQIILELVESSEDQDLLKSSKLEENHILQNCIKAEDHSGLFFYHLNKLILYYMYEQYTDALKELEFCEKYYNKTMISFSIPAFHFYKALTLLAVFQSQSYLNKIKITSTIRTILKKLKHWTQFAPSNNAQKYFLVQAEWAHVRGQIKKAERFYDQAIDAAQRNKFLNEEALANELAARFYSSQRKRRIAKGFLQDAYYCYQHWGASAKAAKLEKLHPEIMIHDQAMLELNPTISISGHAFTEIIDIGTVKKASQILSSTMMLSDLIKKLMQIVIENAGAQKGYLLLNKNGKYFVDAEVTIDHEVKIFEFLQVNEDILPTAVINYVIHSKESLVLSEPTETGQFTIEPYIIKNRPKSILCVPLLNQGVLSGILYLENNLTESAFTKDHIALLNVLSSQMAISIDNARLYTNVTVLNEKLINLNKSYERFVPQEFLNLLEKESITDVVLGDQVQKDMTVFFLDIRNFTNLSEKMTPKENFTFINTFLSLIKPFITKHGGFIDKYIGDAIMALFPVSADSALQSALEIINVLNEYNIKKSNEGKVAIHVGIGINSGPLMLGTVGDVNRMDGTVISDTVNIASRVQNLTKSYQTPILITENTYKRLKNVSQYQLKMIGEIDIRGRFEKVRLYKTAEEIQISQNPSMNDPSNIFEKNVSNK